MHSDSVPPEDVSESTVDEILGDFYDTVLSGRLKQFKPRSVLVPFPYYGGKSIHVKKILPYLPQTTSYVEPFGGAGSILLNRPRSSIEVYNDLDGEIVNFFRTLREKPRDLIFACVLTPRSRAEFTSALAGHEMDTDVERARKTYVRFGQAISGKGLYKSSWSYSVTKANPSKAHTPASVLAEIAHRLLAVHVECEEALNVIRRYDSPETLFYCDPPYVHETRNEKTAYLHEMSAEDHVRLAETLHRIEGRVALSGYKSDLYQELYGDWHSVTFKMQSINVEVVAPKESKTAKQECLRLNYDPPLIRQVSTDEPTIANDAFLWE